MPPNQHGSDSGWDNATPFDPERVGDGDGLCIALNRDLRQDPLIIRGRQGKEAIETAVIAGHEKYDGDFELRIGPTAGNDGMEPTRPTRSEQPTRPTSSSR